ncbi:hypothetical protein [Leeuwenhoekiella sp. LLG6367-2.1]|uniref:hypothetical protein n=1 Tax=Leeuwenhoekiella sp. LLG6367-2.1 TaxID=3160833 RepID=UPI00386B7CAD
MNNKEINQIIKESKSPEWFRAISSDISYNHSDMSISKEGFLDIYNYFQKQVSGWSKIEVELPNELQLSKTVFNRIHNWLSKFIINAADKETNQLNNDWSQYSNQVSSLARGFHFPIDLPLTKFLIDLHRKNPNFYSGAYKFLLEPKNSFNNTPELMSGALMAY